MYIQYHIKTIIFSQNLIFVPSSWDIVMISLKWINFNLIETMYNVRSLSNVTLRLLTKNLKYIYALNLQYYMTDIRAQEWQNKTSLLYLWAIWWIFLYLIFSETDDGFLYFLCFLSFSFFPLSTRNVIRTLKIIRN